MQKVLVINPGSTSTKIAMFDGRTRLWQENIEHDAKTLLGYANIFDQLDMRQTLVEDCLKKHGESCDDISAIMARGGILPPVKGGAYVVNDEMIAVLRTKPIIQHASNLAAAIALNLARRFGVKAYIYDAVTMDELTDVARLTGFMPITRQVQVHNLNMRAAVNAWCEQEGLRYDRVTAIVAHLGGGITFTLHHNGRIIDCVTDEEGAFSPERAGALPTYHLAKYIYETGIERKPLMRKLQREGGLTSLLGVTDPREVEKLIENGDENAKLVYEAMALNVAKSIAMLSVTVCGKVDAIILTGGMAKSRLFTTMVRERVAHLGKVVLIPGEHEMQALADGMIRVLEGKEKARVYSEHEI